MFVKSVSVCGCLRLHAKEHTRVNVGSLYLFFYPCVYLSLSVYVSPLFPSVSLSALATH